MGKELAHCGGRGKHKKVDRLTRAERRARLVQRQEAWTQQWVGLARALAEGILKSEIQELLGRSTRKWGDRSEQVAVRANCNKCQRKWRSWFRRNGSY